MYLSIGAIVCIVVIVYLLTKHFQEEKAAERERELKREASRERFALEQEKERQENEFKIREISILLNCSHDNAAKVFSALCDFGQLYYYERANTPTKKKEVIRIARKHAAFFKDELLPHILYHNLSFDKKDYTYYQEYFHEEQYADKNISEKLLFIAHYKDESIDDISDNDQILLECLRAIFVDPYDSFSRRNCPHPMMSEQDFFAVIEIYKKEFNFSVPAETAETMWQNTDWTKEIYSLERIWISLVYRSRFRNAPDGAFLTFYHKLFFGAVPAPIRDYETVINNTIKYLSSQAERI